MTARRWASSALLPAILVASVGWANDADSSKKAEETVKRASQALEKQDYDQAIALLNEALKLEAKNPSALALRGIALWLAVAYHETKDSPHTSLQPHHRQLLRVLRELRDATGEQPDATAQWMSSGAAA